MDAQEHTQKMEEAEEAYSFDDEDQLTVSQILRRGKNPVDFPPQYGFFPLEVKGAYTEKNDGASKKEERKRLRLEPRCYWNNMHSSDATELSKFSGSDIKNFNIVVNGLTINSKLLSTHVRTKYHDLCCTQKSYIHEGFLPNIDSKMGSLYRKALE